MGRRVGQIPRGRGESCFIVLNLTLGVALEILSLVSLHITLILVSTLSNSNMILPLANASGDGETIAAGRRAVDSIGTQTTLRERGPELAQVGSTGESFVGVEDGVTSLDEVGRAGLPGIVSVLPERSSNNGDTYRAMPSRTSFRVKYLPSVGTPLASNSGLGPSFLPCLSMRFQRTS